MIVSHARKFIYFAVPRTATHSVRAALEPCLGADDWQQQSLSSNVQLPIPELARAGHGHIGVRALRPHLPEDQWRSYYKFAIVRNPYDRFVSVCAFLNRENIDFSADPVPWMLSALDRPRFRERMLVRPQVGMLIDGAGNLAIDFIGRFEQLPAAVDNIAHHIGVRSLELPHRNRSPRKDTAHYLTPALIESLNDLYADDFRLLRYTRR